MTRYLVSFLMILSAVFMNLAYILADSSYLWYTITVILVAWWLDVWRGGRSGR